MTTVIGGSSPSITFSDSTTQSTAFTGLNQSASPYTTSLGYQVLNSNSGTNNVAVGYQAGYSNTTGYSNVSFGRQAGYSISANNYGTFIGDQAGYSTTGATNTFIGAGAGYSVTSGASNTIIGAYSGSGAPISATGSNYIIFSDGSGSVKGWFGAGNNNDLFRVGTTSTSTSSNMHQISYNQQSRFALGITNDASSNPSGVLITYPNSADTSGSNSLLVGANSSTNRFYFPNNGGLYNYSANNSNLSDIRLKKNISLAGSYLSKICQIPIKTFLYNDQSDEELNLGVIAQDVLEIAPELVNQHGFKAKFDDTETYLSIYETDLKYAMLKAIQELKAEFDAYKATHP